MWQTYLTQGLLVVRARETRLDGSRNLAAARDKIASRRLILSSHCEHYLELTLYPKLEAFRSSDQVEREMMVYV
jgi:hypothetical protein